MEARLVRRTDTDTDSRDTRPDARMSPMNMASTRSMLRLGGMAAIAGAALAIAGNAVVLGSGPNVPTNVVSYPLSAHDFRLAQIFFALTQALLLVGIVALAR